MIWRNPLLLCLLTGMASSAWAQSLALTGILGDKALIVIDGSAPKLMAVGERQDAVKLLSIDTNQHQALIEVMGQQSVLRMGASPVSVGSGISQGGAGRFISIPMGSGGHFFTDGYINGRSVKFIVDTGASVITMGTSDADRLGVNYKQNGTPIQMATANGIIKGQRVTLKSVRIDDVEIPDIDAVVGPNMPFVLLGNNFLSRFKMQRNNDMMLLEKMR